MSKEQLAEKTKGLRYMLLRLVSRILAPKSYELFNRKYRPAIGAVKSLFGKSPVVGAEIGVAAGLNALWILKTLNVKRLYLIDPYTPYVEHGEYWTRYVDTESLAHKRLRKYSDQVMWLKKSSIKAAEEIREPLDFVYIDGNHSYPSCLLDISKYFSKLGPGGVIGGHNFEPCLPGVIRAVSTFCHKHNLQYETFKVDWWITLNRTHRT